MENLGMFVDNKKVYAGFGQRFVAALVDMIIFLPAGWLIVYLVTFGKAAALILALPFALLYFIYTVFFHAHFGATIGKMAMKIRVVKPDGSPITYKEAILRSSVDAVFAIAMGLSQIIAISQINPQEYIELSYIERNWLIFELSPSWRSSVSLASSIWFWEELVFLFFNQKNRAIHDFIADTVVVKNELVPT